jgi:hypothetical protein
MNVAKRGLSSFKIYEKNDGKIVMRYCEASIHMPLKFPHFFPILLVYAHIKRFLMPIESRQKWKIF